MQTTHMNMPLKARGPGGGKVTEISAIFFGKSEKKKKKSGPHLVQAEAVPEHVLPVRAGVNERKKRGKHRFQAQLQAAWRGVATDKEASVYHRGTGADSAVTAMGQRV